MVLRAAERLGGRPGLRRAARRSARRSSGARAQGGALRRPQGGARCHGDGGMILTVAAAAVVTGAPRAVGLRRGRALRHSGAWGSASPPGAVCWVSRCSPDHSSSRSSRGRGTLCEAACAAWRRRGQTPCGNRSSSSSRSKAGAAPAAPLCSRGPPAQAGGTTCALGMRREFL